MFSNAPPPLICLQIHLVDGFLLLEGGCLENRFLQRLPLEALILAP